MPSCMLPHLLLHRVALPVLTTGQRLLSSVCHLIKAIVVRRGVYGLNELRLEAWLSAAWLSPRRRPWQPPSRPATACRRTRRSAADGASAQEENAASLADSRTLNQSYLEESMQANRELSTNRHWVPRTSKMASFLPPSSSSNKLWSWCFHPLCSSKLETGTDGASVAALRTRCLPVPSSCSGRALMHVRHPPASRDWSRPRPQGTHHRNTGDRQRTVHPNSCSKEQLQHRQDGSIPRR